MLAINVDHKGVSEFCQSTPHLSGQASVILAPFEKLLALRHCNLWSYRFSLNTMVKIWGQIRLERRSNRLQENDTSQQLWHTWCCFAILPGHWLELFMINQNHVAGVQLQCPQSCCSVQFKFKNKPQPKILNLAPIRSRRSVSPTIFLHLRSYDCVSVHILTWHPHRQVLWGKKLDKIRWCSAAAYA